MKIVPCRMQLSENRQVQLHPLNSAIETMLACFDMSGAIPRCLICQGFGQSCKKPEKIHQRTTAQELSDHSRPVCQHDKAIREVMQRPDAWHMDAAVIKRLLKIH